MLLRLLTLVLMLVPARLAWAADAPQTDPQRIKLALVELEKAWKSDDASARIQAIHNNAQVADGEVIKLVARGLRDKETDVQRAAIDALRFVGHPDALKELQAVARDEKPFKKDPLLYASLLKGVGQYGNASSIAVLSDDVWSIQEEHVIQARILGLGRIRTRESVEKLVDLMKVAGPQRIQAVMPDFRLALVALTGTDQGNSQLGWQTWWNDNRSKLKVEARRPELPKELERKWKTYWGEMEGEDRPRKRNERGKDDPLSTPRMGRHG